MIVSISRVCVWPKGKRRRRVGRPFATCAPLVVLLVSCASPPPKVPLAPLDHSVNANTVYSLAYFAIKHRVCGAIWKQEMEESIARFFKANPDAQVYPGMHGTGDQYAYCVYHQPASLCDATAADFAALSVVMAQDPRLEAFLPFERLLAERNRQCSAAAPIEALSHPRRLNLDARACKKDQEWYRSPLIAMARMMRLSNPAFGAEGHFCRNNAGFAFLETHCRNLREGRRRQLARREFWMPTSLGIEAYLCPLVEPDFNQQR